MSVRNARLAIIAAAAAGVLAIPAAAFAYASSPTPQGSPDKASSAPAPSHDKTPGIDDLTGIAASAGISESRLQQGLVAAKEAGGNVPQGVAALASATGVSSATAQRIVNEVFGAHEDKSLAGPVSVADFARRLGVSQHTAQGALQRIFALSGANGVDPASAAFAAVAHDLGTSPSALAAALDGVKRADAGK